MSKLDESVDRHGSLEILNMEQEFVWIIYKFSKLSLEINVKSPEFRFGINEEWRMSLELLQNDDCSKEHISAYLCITKHNNTNYYSKSSGQTILVDYTVFLIDKEGHEYRNLKGISVFSDKINSWGTPVFINKKILMDDENSFLKDDTLPVYIRIRLVDRVSNLHVGTSKKSIEILKNFEQLFKNDAFSDVTITASNTNFLVHRNILACQSPVFAAMFRHYMKENKENRVIIDDIAPEVVKEMLRFIYCGKVKNLDTLSTQLLAAADKYQLDHLKDVCDGELHKNLSLYNVCDILVAADRYNRYDLKNYALNYISKHSEEIVDTSGFQNLCTSDNSGVIGDAFKHIVVDFNALKEKLKP